MLQQVILPHGSNRTCSSISCRNNSLVLDHQNGRALRSAGAMLGSLRNHKSLTRRKRHSAIFEINEQLALNDIKEFIVLLVLMPVILALDDAEANHRVVHLTKGLVKPLILTSLGDGFLINDFQRSV